MNERTMYDGALRDHLGFLWDEQNTPYRLVQQQAASFFAEVEWATGATLVYGFLRLGCGDCGHDKFVAFSCRRHSLCPSFAARRMAQTAAHLTGDAVPHALMR